MERIEHLPSPSAFDTGPDESLERFRAIAARTPAVRYGRSIAP